jgi:imidazolonepropionase-like amidohydrolase
MKRTLALLLAAAGSAVAQSATSPLIVEHVRVFDGTDVIADTNVVVEDGIIRAVSTKVARPAGAEVVDGRGKTLLPGLIDSHTHTVEQAALEQAPIFGVTTDLDMFTDPARAASIKRQQKEGRLENYADLRSAGYLATAPGGHGTEFGLKIPTLTRPEEAQSWVDARIAEGSDYIKAVLDDGVEYDAGVTLATLSKETLKALADAAHKRGKLLVVHILSVQQAVDAIEAGADGLAHLFSGPASRPDFGKLAASHHVFVVPTLTVLNALCGSSFDGELTRDERLKPYLPPDSIAQMRAHFTLGATSCAGADEAVRQLKAARVPILAGTDTGNPGTAEGASMHGELELLVRAGLTPREALRAATAAPAAAFHLEDRGQIAPGKRADLVLVNGDPTTDIRRTRDIVAVWKAGQKIDRDSWKVAVAKRQEVAARPAPVPPGSEAGWIADFEQDGTPKTKFGVGWDTTTDARSGGRSVVKMEVVADGANGSHGALRLTGEVMPGFAFPFSGVLFFPGAAPMRAANLSAHKALRFWAKGDGQTYQVMFYLSRFANRPVTRDFIAGPQWTQIEVPFAQLGDVDGSDITAFEWAATRTGEFELALDDVQLQ